MDSPSGNSPENDSSGIGVIDKAALVMSTLESGSATLTQLMSTTHLARPTAHHIAVTLELHRLIARDSRGRFILGPRLTELADAAGENHLLSAAGPMLVALRDGTHEPAQLYHRRKDVRICVASVERPVGLCDSISAGVTMSMQGGSAAQVFLAWEEPGRLHRGLVRARFTTTILSAVQRRGWAQSVREREPGVASISTPARGPGGKVMTAVSISGPIERMERQPDQVHGRVVMATARRLSEVFTDTGTV